MTLPVLGLDEPSIRANYWVVQQVLAAGVHGILLCHARSPEAARVMVEASRYPFAERVAGLGQGFRGSGSQTYAAPPVMLQARVCVLKATKNAKIFFLNSCNDTNVVDMIKEGVMICTGGYEAGRKFTKRQMPW